MAALTIRRQDFDARSLDSRDVRALLVGRSSFIGSTLASSDPDGIAITAVDHRGISTLATTDQFDVVLNCALDPAFKSAGYNPTQDADLAAAKFAHRIGAHYVMLSTRRVYSSNAALRHIDENEEPRPDTWYGRNKFESEKRVKDLLGDRCTILRISNVFGYEPGRSGFFGIAVTSLCREQRVILDVSPFVVRDFIPISTLCGTLAAILKNRPAGTFNLGAGFGIPIGQIALWLIQGYGSGELIVNCPDQRDAFVLNVDKLKQRVPECPSVDELEPIVTAIGRTARNAQYSSITAIGEKA